MKIRSMRKRKRRRRRRKRRNKRQCTSPRRRSMRMSKSESESRRRNERARQPPHATAFVSSSGTSGSAASLRYSPRRKKVSTATEKVTCRRQR